MIKKNVCNSDKKILIISKGKRNKNRASCGYLDCMQLRNYIIVNLFRDA